MDVLAAGAVAIVHGDGQTPTGIDPINTVLPKAMPDHVADVTRQIDAYVTKICVAVNPLDRLLVHSGFQDEMVAERNWRSWFLREALVSPLRQHEQVVWRMLRRDRGSIFPRLAQDEREIMMLADGRKLTPTY